MNAYADFTENSRKAGHYKPEVDGTSELDAWALVIYVTGLTLIALAAWWPWTNV